MELLSFVEYFSLVESYLIPDEEKFQLLKKYYDFLQQPITLNMLVGENKWFNSEESIILSRTTYTIKGKCIFVECGNINTKLEWLAGCGIKLLNLNK